MVAKMHRLHLPKIGEGVLHIPGGVPYEADDAPLPYLAGSYMRLGNKEFIYAIAGGSLIPDAGAMNSYSQKVGNVAIAEKALVGATEISLTIVAGTEIAEDELKGGEIVVFPGPANKTFTRGIVSNNHIATGDGGTLVVVMDSPIPVEVIVSGSSAECMKNPYAGVKENQGEWAMVMGMPTCIAIVNQGLWLQVSGPSWIAGVSGTGGPGGAVKLMEAVFRGDGSIDVRGATDARQHAGVVVCPGTDGESQGAPFIMLQIAH